MYLDHYSVQRLNFFQKMKSRFSPELILIFEDNSSLHSVCDEFSFYCRSFHVYFLIYCKYQNHLKIIIFLLLEIISELVNRNVIQAASTRKSWLMILEWINRRCFSSELTGYRKFSVVLQSDFNVSYVTGKRHFRYYKVGLQLKWTKLYFIR